jgi:hypothetical protein
MFFDLIPRHRGRPCRGGDSGRRPNPLPFGSARAYSEQTTGARADSPAGVTARSRLWKNTDVRLAYITKPTLCFAVRAFIRAPAEQSLGSLFQRELLYGAGDLARLR